MCTLIVIKIRVYCKKDGATHAENICSCTVLMILVHSVERMGEDNVDIMSALFTNYPIEASITLLKNVSRLSKICPSSLLKRQLYELL
jgi:hypothetical protein